MVFEIFPCLSQIQIQIGGIKIIFEFKASFETNHLSNISLCTYRILRIGTYSYKIRLPKFTFDM